MAQDPGARAAQTNIAPVLAASGPTWPADNGGNINRQQLGSLQTHSEEIMLARPK